MDQRQISGSVGIRIHGLRLDRHVTLPLLRSQVQRTLNRARCTALCPADVASIVSRVLTGRQTINR